MVGRLIDRVFRVCVCVQIGELVSRHKEEQKNERTKRRHSCECWNPKKKRIERIPIEYHSKFDDWIDVTSRENETCSLIVCLLKRSSFQRSMKKPANNRISISFSHFCRSCSTFMSGCRRMFSRRFICIRDFVLLLLLTFRKKKCH